MTMVFVGMDVVVVVVFVEKAHLVQRMALVVDFLFVLLIRKKEMVMDLMI